MPRPAAPAPVPVAWSGVCTRFLCRDFYSLVTPQAKQNPAETVERERDDEQPEPGHQAPHVKIRMRASTNSTKIAVKVTGLPPIRQR